MDQDTGADINDYVPSDTTPSFFGSSDAPEGTWVMLQLETSGFLAGVSFVKLDANGEWRVDVTETFTGLPPPEGLISGALSDGVYTVTATLVKDPGNYFSGVEIFNPATVAPLPNATPDTETVVIDTRVALVTVALANDSGNGNPAFATDTDNVTNDPTLTGVAELGATVSITINGNTFTTIANDTDGTWTYTPTGLLDDALYGASVTQTDLAGNTSEPVTTFFSLDRVLPPPPTVTHEFAAYQGTAEGGALIRLTINYAGGISQELTTYADAFGVWSIPDGAVAVVESFAVRQTDLAGNTSLPATALSPEVFILGMTADTGADTHDFITSDAEPAFFGSSTAPVGTVIEVTVLGFLSGGGAAVVMTATTTVQVGGTWEIDMATDFLAVDLGGNVLVLPGLLADGIWKVSATLVDGSGNPLPGTTPATQDVVLDTKASIEIGTPIDGAPVIGGSEMGAIIVKGTTTGVEQGQTVTVTFSDGVNTVSRDAVVLSGGEWSIEENPADITGLLDGTIAVRASVEDKAGNAAVDQESVVKDSAVFTLTLELTDDTGTSVADKITNNGDLTVGGVESGALVEYSTDGGKTWSATKPTWAQDGSDDGEITVLARQTDLGGNVSPEASLTFTLDTVVEGLSLTVTDDQTPTPSAVQNAGTTRDTRPEYSGNAEAGALVTVHVTGTAGSFDASTTADDLGVWHITPPSGSELGDGVYSVTVTQTDAAGNTQNLSQGFIVSTTPSEPPAPQATADRFNKATAMTLGEDGQWRIFANGTVMDANGTDSSNVVRFANNVLNGNGGFVGAATFIDFDRDGLMDIIGNDSFFTSSDGIPLSDGQQVFKYMGADAGAVTGTAGQNGNPVNQDYYAFQMGKGLGNTASFPPDTFGNRVDYSNYANVNGSFTGVAAYDSNGDGYVDVVYGAQGFAYLGGGATFNTDDTTFIKNNDGIFEKDSAVISVNSNLNPSGPQLQTGPEKLISTADLNNDGRIDVIWGAQNTQQTGSQTVTMGNAVGGAGTASQDPNRLVVALGQAGGTLRVTQVLNDVLVTEHGGSYNGLSMTWADFNGDGFLDLYQGASMAANGTDWTGNSKIYFNNGAGQFSLTNSYTVSGKSSVSNGLAGGGSVAVDWNADGKMDVIETPWNFAVADATTIPASVQRQDVLLMLNNSAGAAANQAGFTVSVLASLPRQSFVGANGNLITGLLSLDIDWDGDQDMLAFTAKGETLSRINDTQIANGTAMHLRIVDGEGINSLFGNTVQWFDSSGKLVATQIINPQAGNQTNNSAAIVDFYGLKADETYSAVLLKTVNGTASHVGGASSVGGYAIANVNESWSDLKAGAANDAYVLTTEAGNATSNANIGNGIVGTGYNDTFFATLGDDKYEGAGGTMVISGGKYWSSTGGLDIVDYKLAGSAAVTVDLNLTGAQNTGFGTATFSNIEGIAGGDGDDVFTGTAGYTLFMGRGGDDTFKVNGVDTAIDGGSGFDTVLIAGQQLNLNLDNVTGVEQIDLGAGGNNTLNLSLQDVLDGADATPNTLMVKGDNSDAVNLLSGDGFVHADGDVQIIDGVIFDVYHAGSGLDIATLLLEQSVNVQ
jgi:hypothetical protein